jgi:hypothetical protein
VSRRILSAAGSMPPLEGADFVVAEAAASLE